MLFPSIEEKFAQKSPDQVAYDSYDRAIKFYDGSATHYVGRGLAANNLADLPSNKVAALLQDNATAAARRADLPIEKLWARGLRGLASLQESIWVADRAEKIKKLTAAIDDFNVIEKSTLQDTTARESDEYQLFLLARGGAPQDRQLSAHQGREAKAPRRRRRGRRANHQKLRPPPPPRVGLFPVGQRRRGPRPVPR